MNNVKATRVAVETPTWPHRGNLGVQVIDTTPSGVLSRLMGVNGGGSSPDDALVERAYQSVGRPARGHNLGWIQPLGVAPLSLQPRLFRGEGRTDWIVLPLSQDPVWNDRELGVPREPKARLEMLAAARARFDSIVTAYEIPRGVLDGVNDKDAVKRAVLLPELAEDDRVSRFLGTAGLVALGVGVLAGALAAGAAVGSTTLAALGGLASLVSLDPVVLGAVVEHPPAQEGDRAVWFALARWEHRDSRER